MKPWVIKAVLFTIAASAILYGLDALALRPSRNEELAFRDVVDRVPKLTERHDKASLGGAIARYVIMLKPNGQCTSNGFPNAIDLKNSQRCVIAGRYVILQEWVYGLQAFKIVSDKMHVWVNLAEENQSRDDYPDLAAILHDVYEYADSGPADDARQSEIGSHHK